METPTAICPRCKGDVHFVEEAGTKRCPSCGFQFPLSNPAPALADPPPRSGVAEFIICLLKATAVVVGIGLLLLGIAFAGCVMAFR